MTIWRAIRTGQGIMIAILGISHVTFAQASCKSTPNTRSIG